MEAKGLRRQFTAKSPHGLGHCVKRAATRLPPGEVATITVRGYSIDTLLSALNSAGGWSYLSTAEDAAGSSVCVRKVDLKQTSPPSPVRIHTLPRKTILIDHGR
jgi:hypothetical protein